ncbi:MAG TPA: hypothetical protein VIG51_03555 [Candidatus Baltobacteraceae bacterium]
MIPLAVTALALLCAPARAQTIVHLAAQHLAFYYDRFLIEGDGGVRVTLGNGVSIRGDAFSMDLKLNRFLVAGHVHVDSPSGSQDGAAIADFLDFDRAYFVPILGQAALRQAQGDGGLRQAQGDVPDRWTFVGSDFAHPIKGRVMPGDTFYFPDVSGERAFLTTGMATIGARSFVRFGASRVDIAGVYAPLPSYYINFSTDPHLGANSLAGANFDGTYQFAGNANAISALHLRYDTVNKAYLGFEQHVSGSKAYAVFSVNPFTRPSKFWNLRLSDQPSDTFQIQSFSQLHTFQSGLSQPLEAQHVTNVLATQALHRSFLQLGYQFVNDSLLAPTPKNYYGDLNHVFVPNHPSNATLGITGFDTKIKGTPLIFRPRFGFGFAHDAYGLQIVGKTLYTTIWNHYAGLTVYTPAVRLNHPARAFQSVFLNAIVDKQRTWNSAPHFVDSTNTTLSLSRQLDPFSHLTSYLQYNILNTRDVYSKDQAAVYPSIPIGTSPGLQQFEQFAGAATLRTLSLGVLYTNRADFSASLVAEKHTDFPAPVPGLFPLPPTNVLGQYQYSAYFGKPPYDLTADVRFRLDPHTAIDIARTYYFNYPGLRWSPQFIIQVTQ